MERRAVMAERIVDGQVIEACQLGDRDAFRLLFETYKDRVFSIAVYTLGDKDIADDVTQHIFLKLFTAIGKFRGDSEFTTWLYRLVVNACLDEKRRTKRLVPWPEDLATPMTSLHDKKPQEKQYARKEIAEAVQGAIQQLKPRYRLPIVLKYVEGLSYEEIAEVIGCSKGTVASRLNRGHGELAKRLGHLRNQAIWGD